MLKEDNLDIVDDGSIPTYPIQSNIIFTEQNQGGKYIESFNLKGLAYNMDKHEANGGMKEKATFTYNMEYLLMKQLMNSKFESFFLDTIVFSDKSSNYVPKYNANHRFTNGHFKGGTILKHKDGKYRNSEDMLDLLYNTQRDYYLSQEQIILNKYNEFLKLEGSKRITSIGELQRYLKSNNVSVSEMEKASFDDNGKTMYFIPGRDFLKEKRKVEELDDEGNVKLNSNQEPIIKGKSFAILDEGLIHRIDVHRSKNLFEEDVKKEITKFKEYLKDIGYNHETSNIVSEFLDRAQSESLKDSQGNPFVDSDTVLDYYFALWALNGTALTQFHLGDVHQFAKKPLNAEESISDAFITSTKRNTLMTSSGTPMHFGSRIGVEPTE
ncbi:MAG: hypothetical protein ACPGDB_04900, partial [Fusobacterium sp.]